MKKWYGLDIDLDEMLDVPDFARIWNKGRGIVSINLDGTISPERDFTLRTWNRRTDKGWHYVLLRVEAENMRDWDIILAKSKAGLFTEKDGEKYFKIDVEVLERYNERSGWLRAAILPERKLDYKP